MEKRKEKENNIANKQRIWIRYPRLKLLQLWKSRNIRKIFLHNLNIPIIYPLWFSS